MVVVVVVGLSRVALCVCVRIHPRRCRVRGMCLVCACMCVALRGVEQQGEAGRTAWRPHARGEVPKHPGDGDLCTTAAQIAHSARYGWLRVVTGLLCVCIWSDARHGDTRVGVDAQDRVPSPRDLRLTIRTG